jgi:outer membrane protein assembly factor BamB
MPELPFRHGHASRVPQAPIVLAPPLTEVWSEWFPHPVRQLPLVAGGVVAYRQRATLHARREADGRKLWTAKATDTDPACIRDGELVAWLEPSRASFLRLETGENSATLPVSTLARCLVSRDLLVGSMVQHVAAYDLDARRQAWTWEVDPPQFGTAEDANFLDMTSCADDERLYFGLRDGTVRALALKDGREAWRQDAFPERKRGLPEVKGVAFFAEGAVFVRSEYHVGAFDGRTGRRRWAREFETLLRDGCVYGDRYYALGSGGAYSVLDLRDGRDVFRSDLRKQVPEKMWERNDTFHPLLVSETHLFCGLGVGYFLAFERDTARLVWNYRPKPHASFHPDSYFQAVGNRLYTGDLSFLRVFEPETPAAGRGSARTARSRPAAAAKKKR